MSCGFYRMGSNVPGKVMPKLVFVGSLVVDDPRASETAPAIPRQAPAMADTPLSSEVTKMGRDQAKQSGYTGDPCSQCGSMKMVHSGTCNTCQDCFTTTGCS